MKLIPPQQQSIKHSFFSLRMRRMISLMIELLWRLRAAYQSMKLIEWSAASVDCLLWLVCLRGYGPWPAMALRERKTNKKSNQQSQSKVAQPLFADSWNENESMKLMSLNSCGGGKRREASETPSSSGCAASQFIQIQSIAPLQCRAIDGFDELWVGYGRWPRENIQIFNLKEKKQTLSLSTSTKQFNQQLHSN